MMMDIEITSRPFTKGRLKKIKRDLRLGKIRRFAAIVSHQKLGFSHNALVAWEKSSLSQKLSNQLKNKDYISHIYLRKANYLWPYGLYTMLHAKSQRELKALIAGLSKLMDNCAYKALNTIKEFKKTSFNPKKENGPKCFNSKTEEGKMPISKFSKVLLFSLLAVFVFPLSSFSQTPTEEETLTITTYYPAPYGVYNEMRSKRMAVGTNYYDGSAYPWDTGGGCTGSEICNADLVVQGNVGIGTTNPQFLLDIKGSASNASGGINISDGTVNFRLMPWGVDGFTYFTNTSNHGLSFGTNNAWARMVISNTGNVGIGTTNPARKLVVTDTATYLEGPNNDIAAFHQNSLDPGHAMVYIATNDLPTGNEYFLHMRTFGAGADDKFLFRTDGTAMADGGAASGGWSGPADYAEYFETNDTDLDKGELVGIDPNNAKFIKRALGVSGHYLLGVISTKPGFVGVVADDVSDAVAERENNPRWKIVGLLGQIPAKVSLENGPINIGDPLTSSSTPGMAMKATRTGQIVGIALEEFKGEKAEGKILCFINPHTWVAPSEFEELKVRLTKLEAEIGR